ncbi:MAG: CRTAC1 family protein, partial [Planctomycetota bacterium]|nr:CRTAC1 family protein [Planctomycetota bacterium]
LPWGFEFDTAFDSLALEAPRPPLGAAFFDADGDGDRDLLLVGGERSTLFTRRGGGLAEPRDVALGEVRGNRALVRVADFNNDGLPDVFLADGSGATRLHRGRGGDVHEALPESGLSLAGIASARWLDYDHDGDLDLAVAQSPTGEGARRRLALLRNNGDETFEPRPDLLPDALTVAATPWAGEWLDVGDLDGGNDIDLVHANPGGPVALYRNTRTGAFRRQLVEGLEGHPLVAVVDLDRDGNPDIVGAPHGDTPLRVAWNRHDPRGADGILRFEVTTPGGLPPIAESRQLVVSDFDNDGDRDVLLVSGQGLLFLANRRGGELELTPVDWRGADPPSGVGSVHTADVDGDGRLDLLIVAERGTVTLWRGRAGGGEGYASASVLLTGVRDNRDGVGAHVEVFAGPSYQRLLVQPSGGVRFGLGETGRRGIDGINVLWPDGVRQPLFPEDLSWDDENRLRVRQKAGLNVSCPFLYTHDGVRYRFLTDVVGIAPLDEWTPEGTEPHLDPEEYVRVEEAALRPRAGRLRAVITEELREVTYLDRVELIRLRHPRGTLVFTDESTRQGGVEPLRLFVVEPGDLLRPAAVRDGQGQDGLSEVLRVDRRYLHAYREGPGQWAGWVEPFTIDVEMPGFPAPPASPGDAGVAHAVAALILTGRIAWQDSGVAFALDQHGRRWEPHRLEALTADGVVVGSIPDVGFPCGMDRTMVVPLAGRLAEAHTLRLRATSRLFWDRIALASRAVAVELGERGEVPDAHGGRLRSDVLPLLAARLDHHGFSRAVGDVARHEQTYEFSDAGPLREFPSPTGRATRHGDVRELLERPDDRLVVLAPGDGVFLEFAAGSPGGPDEDLTYFLRITGWAKEGGFHNRTGRSIAPLPHHGMARYPEGASPPPAAEAYRRYLETYQTRRVRRAW